MVKEFIVSHLPLLKYGFYSAMILLCAVWTLWLMIKVIKSKRVDKVAIHATRSEPFAFQVVTMQNQGKREYQQDSFYVSDATDKEQLHGKGLFALVADGMGGLQEGTEISKITADTFESLFADSTVEDPHHFLCEGIYRAETYVDDFREEKHIKGGTTFVGTIIKGHALYHASVGDSYILHIRKNKITQLNKLHNYAASLENMVKDGAITKEEAEKDPRRTMLTAYVGMGEVTAIDAPMVPLHLLPGDIIMLCSDGVVNALGDDALLRLIRETPFEALGEALEQEILRQNIPNQDNNTAVLIRCRDVV